MGICDVTADVAEKMITQFDSPTAGESFLLYILRGMPLFLDIGRLDLFDQVYREVAPEDSEASYAEQLIDSVFWLGAYNFYGAITERSTREHYQKEMLPRLREASIELPADPDLSCW